MRPLALCVIAACHAAPRPAPASSTPAAPPPREEKPASCSAQVDQMTSFWTAMDHSPSLRLPADVQLLVRPGTGSPTLDGPVVIVRAGGYEYFGQQVDAAALSDKLA